MPRHREHQPVARRLARAAPSVALAACLAAVCVVPALFDPRAERVFDEPKAIVLWSLAAVAAAALVVTLLLRPWRSFRLATRGLAPLVGAAMLTLAYVVASVASIAPRLAWDGAYVRRFGASTPASSVVVLIGLLLVARRWRSSRLVIGAVLIGSVVPVAYAICQRTGLDIAVWNNPAIDRATSTAGNPIFLAGYLAMVWPVTLGYVVSEGRSAAGYAAAALLAAQAVAMVIAGSVGAAVGLVAGIVVLASVLLDRVGRRFRSPVVVLLVVGAIVSIVAAAQRRPFQPTAHGIEPGGQSGQVRLVLWRSTIRLLGESRWRAAWGYGPDTTRWTLGTSVRASLRPFEGSATADRAHNAVLDTALTIGTVGVLARTALFVLVCVTALRRLGAIVTRSDAAALGACIVAGWLLCAGMALGIDRTGGLLPLAWSGGLVGGLSMFAAARRILTRGTEPLRQHDLMCAALLAGVIAHYVESQTGIETTTTELCFWLFAGLIVIMPRSAAAASDPDGTNVPVALMSGLMLAVVTFDFGDRLFELGSPLFLFIVLGGATLAVGIALGWSDRTARRAFIPLSCGVWATFVGVSRLSTAAVRSAADAVDPAVALLTTYALGQIIGLAVTITAVVAAVAWSIRRRAAHVPARPAPAIAGTAAVLMMAVVAVEGRNITTLYADELSGIGLALGQVEQWQAALRLHQRSVELKPREDVYLARLGDARLAMYRQFADLSQLDDAIDAYRSAHGLAAYDGTYLRQLAVLESVAADASSPATADGHLRTAAAYLAEAAQLEPHDPEVWNSQAKIALRAQQASVAAAALERSLALDDGTAETHLLYGDALLALGDAARALREYETADAIGLADRLPAVSGRALALVRLDRIDEAIDANLDALRLAPNDFVTHKNLALLYERVGNLEAAAAYASAAASMSGAEDREPLEELARSLRSRIRAGDTRSR